MTLHNLSDFQFPFEPYNIQNDFMTALYDSLQEGKLGIFESPTGTGKSLSLICGALTWLKSYSEKRKAELETTAAEVRSSDPNEDWFLAATKRQKEEEIVREAKRKLKTLQLQDERIKKIIKLKKESKVSNINLKSKSLWKNNDAKAGEPDSSKLLADDDLIPDDYDSDNNSDEELSNDENDDGCLKIYYCSRTHSQLSQFVNEIKKTPFSEQIRVTSLASRQNLCINETVSSLSNLSLINERCLDMQNSKGYTSTKLTEDGIGCKKQKTSNSCPYYKQSLLANISSHILTEVQDLEDLGHLGKQLKACPYYGSKHSIKDAQLVVLPYNTILHQKTRRAYNISLKDNIVIVDEAHNLLETLANIHSVFVTLKQFEAAHSQLSEYFKKYGKRFSAKNVLYIRQILHFIKSFIRIFKKPKVSLAEGDIKSPGQSSVKTVHEVLCDTLTENLQFLKIIQFIDKSKLTKKLYGFSKKFYGKVESTAKSGSNNNEIASFLQKMGRRHSVNAKESEPDQDDNVVVDAEFTSSSSMLNVVELMRTFICCISDGRVLINHSQDSNNCSIKYFLLNPASQFHLIVKECRSVILAGGTMSPMDEFKQQLFLSAGAEESRIADFSCGHVVCKENILPIAIGRGPTQALDFTYKNRTNAALLKDLGDIIVKICSVVPGGVVCFLPSYDYEKKVFQHFTDSGVLSNISSKKKVFREPKEGKKLDSVLAGYASAVKHSKDSISGAILFCVVGGKMSEGINFSDDLGRCVVMVGLPYPNSHSPELKEKMAYLNKHFPRTNNVQSAGDILYENMCFKAVNQSIGRSIRHRNDYAAILLLDQRYERESSKKSLPSWISSNLKSCKEFERAVTHVKQFFAIKQE